MLFNGLKSCGHALAALSVIVTPATAFAGQQLPGFELVHNAPVETSLATPDLRDAGSVWVDLISHARQSVDFEQFYVAGGGGTALDRVITAMESAGRRGVRIRFLMEQKGVSMSDEATLNRLKAIPNLTFRLLPFAQVSGDGIIHAKFFTVDGRQSYIGSQNFDWRSLEQIDETGVLVSDAHIVGQVQAIFAHDWNAQQALAQGHRLEPLRHEDDKADEGRRAFLVASPNAFDPKGVGDSQAALIRLIDGAKRSVHVEVMEYSPLSFSGAPYPLIDQALRRAAARGVEVRLLIADWSLSPKRQPGLLALGSVPGVEIRVATIPQAPTGPIPFARVVHTKVMVVDDETAWVGTSNWEGGYLDNSRNLELVFRDKTMAARVDALENSLWTSAYVQPLKQAIEERARKANPS
ncbi:phospholipase D-like domain-containing protein [Novosphingobium sp.]|uniref:phospholipase D-like domain-containing protein n=1 Tax=Novosphingobium sp. TaxID=1874826 RepID=UPI0031D7AD52